MISLSMMLSERVNEWRKEGYLCDEYPLISELLDYQKEGKYSSRYLREAQFKALEIYWYLRVKQNTKPCFELYNDIYKTSELLDQFNLKDDAINNYVLDNGINALWQKVMDDGEFVKKYKLYTLQEVLKLTYPSYIFALAMGAGKTVLIGTIIATEFSMAMEYEDDTFMKNALVFAPGKTIIESLKELAIIPYDLILPPRLYKQFASNLKMTVTRDGQKDIPVLEGSSYNIVITNIEKIRIQKEKVRKGDLGQVGILTGNTLDDAKQDVANLRLQKIVELPHLGVFSDEAHHTYGQPLDYDNLKKVRKTIDYIANNTKLICVVNTTGTPYYKKHMLPDVVYWYGLSEGIRDGILKDVSNSIYSYNLQAEEFVKVVIDDFFTNYKDVKLANGATAKIAIYFPKIADLDELRPVIETALPNDIPPTSVLRNVQVSHVDEIEAFNRLNDPTSQHRVILLVGKGTEGWNCPSLFSCALARKIGTSNNLVLQASARCLRQVPGNDVKARIYLSQENVATLEKELENTFRESIATLKGTERERKTDTIVFRKYPLPPLVTKFTRRTVIRNDEVNDMKFNLQKPIVNNEKVYKETLDLTDAVAGRFLKQHDQEELFITDQKIDIYSLAVDLTDTYRLNLWHIYNILLDIYPDKHIPANHIGPIRRQIESQTSKYTIVEEEIEIALALVKPEGFTQIIDDEGHITYTAEITYFKDREHLLKHHQGEEYGYHYTPYNFDSGPEKVFFDTILNHLELNPSEVDDIYFTGALTDPAKTDFYLWYKDEENKWRRYTPDFIIRKKSGKCLIVEVKNEQWRGEVEAVLDNNDAPRTKEGMKALALKKWTKLNSDKLKYQIIFADTLIAQDAITDTLSYIRGDKDE